MSPQPEDEEDYFLPLEDQRVFGAGIRRKRVPFVRSSEHELNTFDPGSPGQSGQQRILGEIFKGATRKGAARQIDIRDANCVREIDF